MSDEEYTQSISQCNKEQEQILSYVAEKVNKTDTSPLHMFITGGAGSGKSYLLKLLREHLLRMNTTDFPNFLVAAPTGVAAFNIKAWTLHRLLHLDVQKKKQAEYHKLSSRLLEKMRTLFKNTKVLIIDEISMVSVNTLLHIHRRLTEIMDTAHDPEIFFGGCTSLHLVICFNKDQYMEQPFMLNIPVW